MSMQPETTREEQLSTAKLVEATSNETPLPRKSDDQAARAPLFAEQEGTGFKDRWTDIQASFVDEPRQAVEQADTLVAEVMQRLAQVFADERKNLEQQWDRGGDTNTEELRLALRRYRSFFDRLLSL
jgi:hypothetical protein